MICFGDFYHFRYRLRGNFVDVMTVFNLRLISQRLHSITRNASA